MNVDNWLRCLTLLVHYNAWVDEGEITEIEIENGIVRVTTRNGNVHNFYEDGIDATDEGIHLPGDAPRHGLIVVKSDQSS